jgi:energy-coupling factor transporter ATP-binding protein EcfA2
VNDPILEVTAFAQIRRARLTFGDLTLLVGPQATGKSLLLQLLKLGVDAPRVAGTLRQRGFTWRDREQFCAVYFGDGLQKAWRDETQVTFKARAQRLPPARATQDAARLFYIPAHRTLSVAEGWPAGFRSYRPDTPFVVRDFSETLLGLLTSEANAFQDQVFPQRRRFKDQVRDLIDQAVFHGGQLRLLADGPRRQFKLVYPNAEVAYMAWTAGQREFIPLLLGLYHLVPLGAARKVRAVDWVVIEEPEMGLHAKAVQAVLLLLLELMQRGYRVVVSTHSAALVEVVWALQQLKVGRAKPRHVRALFELESRQDIDALARASLDKTYRVHHLDYKDGEVESQDISNLDPAASAPAERTWGDLLSQSERANAVVAAVAADQG